MKADELEAALVSQDFVECRRVLVIGNPFKLPGFSTNLDRDRLRGPGAVDYVMRGYPDAITVRRHKADWKVSLEYERFIFKDDVQDSFRYMLIVNRSLYM